MTVHRAVCTILVLAAGAATATPSRASAQEVSQASAQPSSALIPRVIVGEERVRAPTERRSRTVIGGDELRSAVQSNLYDLIRTARPRWMSQRGRTSLGGSEGVRVYVDGHPAGGLSVLRTINTSHVRGVAYLDAGAATIQWGLGHPNGAILVSTRSGV